jgi:hypothetical protein
MRKNQYGKNIYVYIVLISVALCLIGILFFYVRYHLLTINNYFINFDDSEQAYEIVASQFLIAETTKTEVENALADGIFGNIDCNYYWAEIITTVDLRIICEALGSYGILFPKYYRINLDFYENVLTEIKIEAFYPNAP